MTSIRVQLGAAVRVVRARVLRATTTAAISSTAARSKGKGAIKCVLVHARRQTDVLTARVVVMRTTWGWSSGWRRGREVHRRSPGARATTRSAATSAKGSKVVVSIVVSGGGGLDKAAGNVRTREPVG